MHEYTVEQAQRWAEWKHANIASERLGHKRLRLVGLAVLSIVIVIAAAMLWQP